MLTIVWNLGRETKLNSGLLCRSHGNGLIPTSAHRARIISRLPGSCLHDHRGNLFFLSHCRQLPHV